MEEDIKMLEWSQQQMRLGNLPDYNQKVYKAIENLINRNKEIEEDYTSVYLSGFYDGENKWKSKIKEKIEELKQEGNYKTIENPNGRVHFQLEPCDYKIQVLEELLQEGE